MKNYSHIEITEAADLELTANFCEILYSQEPGLAMRRLFGILHANPTATAREVLALYTAIGNVKVNTDE